jgi:hypothetical protein
VAAGSSSGAQPETQSGWSVFPKLALCQGTTLQAAEKLKTEGGGGFNPRVRPAKMIAGFSPGGMFSVNFTRNIEFLRSMFSRAEKSIKSKRF